MHLLLRANSWGASWMKAEHRDSGTRLALMEAEILAALDANLNCEQTASSASSMRCVSPTQVADPIPSWLASTNKVTPPAHSIR